MADDESSRVNMDGGEEEEVGSITGDATSINSVQPGDPPEPSKASVQNSAGSQSSQKVERQSEPSIKEGAELSAQSIKGGAESAKQMELSVQSIPEPALSEGAESKLSQPGQPSAQGSTSIKNGPSTLSGSADAESEEPPALAGPSGASSMYRNPDAVNNSTSEVYNNASRVSNASELGQGAEFLSSKNLTPEPEPPRYVEPLGEATEESLLDRDIAPWILDKLYREGRMGRFATIDGKKVKEEDGGISTYEDYTWRLEKLYRQVPEDMGVGKVRSKPESQIYEEERWVLGKMFRDIHEEDYGYQPSAERQESAVDLCYAIEVSKFPPEPPMCPRPASALETTFEAGNDQFFQSERREDCNCPPTTRMPCTGTVTATSGKVFEFSYTGLMAVSVDSPASAQGGTDNGGTVEVSCFGPPSAPPPIISTQNMMPQSNSPTGFTCGGGNGSNTTAGAMPSVQSFRPDFRSAEAAQSTCAGSNSTGASSNTGTCRNNMRCESRIQAVCDAARKAMAIYDTMTGCDNFPCNEGDKPEKEFENIEDGVWPWLYQLIFRMLPVDSNQNQLVTIPEESSYTNNDQKQQSGQSTCFND